MSISDYWRTSRSNNKDLEVEALRRAAETLARAYEEDVEVGWKGAQKNNNALELDTGKVVEAGAPIEGEVVDGVMGMLLHEVGCIHTNYVKTSMSSIPDDMRTLLEDYAADQYISNVDGLAGKYVTEARELYRPKGVEKLQEECRKVLMNLSTDPAMEAKAFFTLADLMVNYQTPPSTSLPAPIVQGLLFLMKSAPEVVDKGARVRMVRYTQWWNDIKRITGLVDVVNDQRGGGGGAGKGRGLKSYTTELRKKKGGGGVAGQQMVEAANEAAARMSEDLAPAVQAVVGHGVGAGGVRDDRYVVRDAGDTGAPNGKPDEELSAALKQFQTEARRVVRGLEDGSLSRKRLWRAGLGDNHFREQKIKVMDTGVLLVLLLDNSGSIHDPVWDGIMVPLAESVAQLSDLDTEVYVLAYTEYGRAVVDRMFRPGWGSVRRGVSNRSGTPSAVGMAAAWQIMAQSGKKTKVMVHVTDGQPGHVGGVAGEESVRLATQKIHEEGGVTITIRTGSPIPAHEDPNYGVLVGVSKMEEVGKAMEEVVEKVLMEVRDGD